MTTKTCFYYNGCTIETKKAQSTVRRGTLTEVKLQTEASEEIPERNFRGQQGLAFHIRTVHKNSVCNNCSSKQLKNWKKMVMMNSLVFM